MKIRLNFAERLERDPGAACHALRIDRALDGRHPCQGGALWLAQDDQDPGDIGQGVRIGITKEADRRLQFFVFDNPYVSGPGWLNAR